MRIVNVTRQQVLGDCVKVADSFLARLVGLLATSSLPTGAGLLIKPCNSVHTLGMRYPIDVIFVNEAHRVLKIVAGLKSGRMSAQPGARYVIELPAGTIALTDTQPGDQLELQ
ncbi:DUF192 domain-containing protein [Sporomusa acidovorans]|uniref:ACR n=1 Tax=Sporomusa acidovorans (strain ATCC 49682 / DSM 3132 / Mol) TaxID=1123286 RepID=A0ABZ3IWT7_SPOA4|nr:DUF192 domain-containing protein [Sporomusa acidovorans]OZC13993.1 hypothetical protein SPACI_54250 [Sporomusa acidovorans DSM 3132]SDF21964.1 hypothetical protein SAMN04488499_103827 [Sporomusa acidovorans]